jgi:predicted alpha/beta-hydrolase family hydrolase
MTSQAQAIDPLPGVKGLAFIGFPLHPAGKPSAERAEHLLQVKIPMLFCRARATSSRNSNYCSRSSSGSARAQP